jgi:hypothetical protein
VLDNKIFTQQMYPYTESFLAFTFVAIARRQSLFIFKPTACTLCLNDTAQGPVHASEHRGFNQCHI